MSGRIYESTYKDQLALTIESEAIKAQFLPGIGAKLASLVFKPRDFELMVQGPGKEYRMQSFDGDYVAGECTGFDDMFPTIDLCYYDKYPWQGTKMADHGEVWSLPWHCEIDGDRLHLSVYGVRFPYRLEKWVGFCSDEVLRLEYRLTNLSPFDFDFVWAAHMMINLVEGTHLVLPEQVRSIVGTFSFSDTFGSYGDEFSWPVGTLSDGSQRDFRHLQAESDGDTYKYFVKGAMPEGWCGLKYHRRDFALALSFPVDKVPYLGVLPNEDNWHDYYNIFLEPCTASFDRPDTARYRGEQSSVMANATYDWHLNITLAEGAEFRSVSDDGDLVR